MTAYDIRLKENFKLFISGPSRCGKTFLVADLISNINTFAKQPPEEIIYIYSVWQWKYDEMRSIVHHFIKDDENVFEKIQELCAGKRTLLVMDDLMNSKSLPTIAKLFTVDARHMDLSLIFLSQRLFKNDEAFRQITRNSDYYCVFKSVRDVCEIRTLAQQMTPGSLDLVYIFQKATKNPWSYLFIDLTQECDEDLRYRYNLFNFDHYVPIIKPL